MSEGMLELIYYYLVNYGQQDHRFSLGETIKYSPSEIKEILKGMPKIQKSSIDYGHVIAVRNKCEKIRQFLDEVMDVCDTVEKLTEWRKTE